MPFANLLNLWLKTSAVAFFVSSLFLPSTLATDSSYIGKVDVEDYYNVATGDVAGSCDAYMDDLNAYLGEAFDMSAAAFDVLTTLQEPTGGTVSDVRLTLQLWGIDLVGLKRDGLDASKLPKNQVMATYFIQAVYETISPEKWFETLDSKPRLYCDSTFLVYTETAYDRGAKTTDPILLKDGRTAKNAYWFEAEEAYLDIGTASSTATVCDEGHLGGTNLPNSDTIILCPNLLKGKLTTEKKLALYATGEKAIVVGTVDDEGNQVIQGDNIDAFRSISSVWLHEMSHLVGSAVGYDIIDQPGYDGKGNPIPQIKDADGHLPPGVLSYGFSAILNLCWWNAAKTQTNADTYAYFAIGCYLRSVDWAAGAALPLRVNWKNRPRY